MIFSIRYFFSITARRVFAQINFSLLSVTIIAYSASSLIASATLPGNVHGVVVHTRKYALSPNRAVSLILNFTYTDGSGTLSLYPKLTSKLESGVAHRG